MADELKKGKKAQNVQEDINDSELENEASQDKEFDMGFANDMMENYKNVLSMFESKPDVFKNALKPILEMQKNYMDDPEKISGLLDNMGSDGDFQTNVMNSLEDLRKLVKKVAIRVGRLERRLEEANVIKTEE